MSFPSFVANKAVRLNECGPYLFKINDQVDYKFRKTQKHPENAREGPRQLTFVCQGIPQPHCQISRNDARGKPISTEIQVNGRHREDRKLTYIA